MHEKRERDIKKIDRKIEREREKIVNLRMNLRFIFVFYNVDSIFHVYIKFIFISNKMCV